MDNDKIKVYSAGDTEEFKKAEKKQKKFKNSNKPIVILGVLLIVLYFGSVLFFVDYSAGNFSIAWAGKIIHQNFKDFSEFVTGRPNGIQFTVYRYLIIILAGGALSVCGAVFQGVFRNGLASPTTLGVESGGSVGNIIYVLLFVSAGSEITVTKMSDSIEITESIGVMGRNLQQLMVLAFCFLGVFLIVGISTAAGRGKLSSSAMILSSMLFSSFIGTFSGIVQYYLTMSNPYDPRIYYLRSLSMGSFERSFTLEHLVMIAIPLIPCMVIMILLSGRMNAFAFGDEEARAMGISVKKFKYTAVAVGTVMTAVVLSYCGQIGLVGFMIPHAARKITGPDYKKLIPGSLLLGAIVMIVVYDIAKFLYMTFYINLFTSVIGSIVMVFMFISQRRKRNAAYAD